MTNTGDLSGVQLTEEPSSADAPLMDAWRIGWTVGGELVSALRGDRTSGFGMANQLMSIAPLRARFASREVAHYYPRSTENFGRDGRELPPHKPPHPDCYCGIHGCDRLVYLAHFVAAMVAVGTLQGLPVYLDPNLPTNLGAGTNQDPAIVARFEDLFLWETPPVAASFDAPYADSMGQLLRLHLYCAFLPQRYPAAIAVINGTGMVGPTL